jgi:hypothetical protein
MIRTVIVKHHDTLSIILGNYSFRNVQGAPGHCPVIATPLVKTHHGTKNVKQVINISLGHDCVYTNRKKLKIIAAGKRKKKKCIAIVFDV